MRRTVAWGVAGLVLICAFAGVARGGTVFLLSGRGWGHGVGMSQWGARGYAQHGWNWPRILAHYYPGTRLSTTGNPQVRILLAQDAHVATVGCATRMRVSDATGVWRPLKPLLVGLGPKLALPLRRRLRPPLVFDCPGSPLALDGNPYRGELVLRSDGGALSVVDVLPLESYLQGVVGAEMPSHWSLAALEAQAVAARSYALATLHPEAKWDLFADDRSQEYLGLRAEGPRTDQAVAATRGKVLTWGGSVITAYYSSSSGGRTADVRDLDPGSPPVPYLRSVADPYDVLSPQHEWGPLAITQQQLGAKLGLAAAVESLRLVRGPAGRVEAVVAKLASGASVRLVSARFEADLKLDSTWFRVGTLSLGLTRGRVLFGRRTQLVARTTVRAGALLQRRSGSGPWRTLRNVGTSARVTVRPAAATQFRLVAAAPVAGPEVSVAVTPRVRLLPLTPRLLAGAVEPRPDGAVTISRYTPSGWRVVARPRLDAHGRFLTRMRLRAGGYRVAVPGDARLTGTETRLRVTRRLLASIRR